MSFPVGEMEMLEHMHMYPSAYLLQDSGRCPSVIAERATIDLPRRVTESRTAKVCRSPADRLLLFRVPSRRPWARVVQRAANIAIHIIPTKVSTEGVRCSRCRRRRDEDNSENTPTKVATHDLLLCARILVFVVAAFRPLTNRVLYQHQRIPFTFRHSSCRPTLQ